MGTELEGELCTFVDNLFIDRGVDTTGELETLILYRMVWRRVILDPRAAPVDKS